MLLTDFLAPPRGNFLVGFLLGLYAFRNTYTGHLKPLAADFLLLGVTFLISISASIGLTGLCSMIPKLVVCSSQMKEGLLFIHFYSMFMPVLVLWCILRLPKIITGGFKR
jgi:hypothetical protein